MKKKNKQPQDKKEVTKGLGNFEEQLIAAAKGPRIELSVREIRRTGLIAALRERVAVKRFL